jgi:hypothetical protein
MMTPKPTRLSFYIDVPGDREAALDRRDEITAALAALGIRISLTDDRTDVYMADRAIPTLGDALTGSDPV